MRKKNPRKKSFLFLMTELSSGPLLHQPETQLYCTHHWIPAPSLQGMKSHIAKPPVPFPKAWLLPDLFHGSLQHFPWFRLILCSAQSTKLTALRDLPLQFSPGGFLPVHSSFGSELWWYEGGALGGPEDGISRAFQGLA